MPRTFLPGLPPEVLVNIVNFLPFKARLAFASTDPRLHRLLAPILFSAVRVTNRTEEVEIVEHVVARYARYIRHIHFQCYLYQNHLVLTEEEKQNHLLVALRVPYVFYRADKNQVCTLPASVGRLLSGENLSALHAITITFIPHDEFAGSRWVDGSQHGGLSVYSDVESAEVLLERERSLQWRKVMLEVCKAVSENTSISRLEILGLIPREISLWTSPEWKSFLARLERLSIHLWAATARESVYYETQGCTHFRRNLNIYFFDHCSGLTHLEISGTEESHCGQGKESIFIAPFALHATHLHKLRVLVLRHSFMDCALKGFLVAHSKTLQQLTLVDCNMFSPDADSEVMTWADLFKAIRFSEPVLQSFRLLDTQVIPLHEDDSSDEDLNEKNGSEEIRAIRKSIKSGHRKIFSYSCAHRFSGLYSGDVSANRRHFTSGDDQREYDELMSLVIQNAYAHQGVEMVDRDSAAQETHVAKNQTLLK